MDDELNSLLRSFEHVGLTHDAALQVSTMREHVRNLANHIADTVEGPEAVVALRKLLECKDSAIRGIIFGGN